MHWKRADAKTALCALANLKPLEPCSENGGEPINIDVGEALTINSNDALPRIFASASGELASSLANRVFWQPSQTNLPSENGTEGNAEDSEDFGRTYAPVDPAVVLAMAEPDVLASHAISESAIDALRRGDSDRFLEARNSDIQRTVEDFVDARAEWDHPARPPLASL